MPKGKRPHHARITVPVDHVTAARAAAAGHEVERVSARKASLDVQLPLDHELVSLASDHATAVVTDDELHIDLTAGLRQLLDESPPVPSAVPGPDRWPLWSKPAFEQSFAGMVQLGGTSTVDDLPAAIESWICGVPPVDIRILHDLEAAWRCQAQRMLDHAVALVNSLPADLTSDERHRVVSRLSQLARQVRHARDGGLDPEDPDLEVDAYGDRYHKPAHSYINEAYQQVLDACERTSGAGGDRLRSESAHEELRAIAWAFSKKLPRRYVVADNVGLLDSLLGAARRELISVVWDGWRYVAEGEELKAVANPGLDELDRLVAERAIDKKTRTWQHDQIQLGWLVPTKLPVLTSSFLGRTIIKEITDKELA